MIASIWFDDVVVIRGGQDYGAHRGDLREQSFHAEDGWRIEERTKGEFQLWIAGMDRAVYVGGYGYSYILAPTLDVGVSDDQTSSEVQALEASPEPTTGKRRRR